MTPRVLLSERTGTQAMDWILRSGWARFGERAPLLVHGDVGDDERVAGGGDPSGDAFAERDAEALEAFGVFAYGDGVVELLGGFVDHEHGPAFGAEELGHLVHDDEEDGFQLQGLGECARDLMKDAQMVHLPALNDCELTLLCQTAAPQ